MKKVLFYFACLCVWDIFLLSGNSINPVLWMILPNVIVAGLFDYLEVEHEDCRLFILLLFILCGIVSGLILVVLYESFLCNFMKYALMYMLYIHTVGNERYSKWCLWS